jgi:hypothetical protein
LPTKEPSIYNLRTFSSIAYANNLISDSPTESTWVGSASRSPAAESRTKAIMAEMCVRTVVEAEAELHHKL